jgi:hypothetical protein
MHAPTLSTKTQRRHMHETSHKASREHTRSVQARRLSHLRAHDSFDGVCDQITRLQGVGHAIRTHRNAITHTDSVEAEADQPHVRDPCSKSPLSVACRTWFTRLKQGDVGCWHDHH